jgi:RNA polymerase sigma-70 factor, ECF subfamily
VPCPPPPPPPPPPEDTDWPRIATLYGRLVALQPSPVVELNRAAAVAMADGPESGLRLLDPLEGPLDRYQPFHSARAELLRRAGRPRDAAGEYRRALEMTANDAERRFLERRLAALQDA